jgi:signal transduction histidine kinase
MPFERVRWRLAAWNLAILGLVLLTTLGAVALAELREIQSHALASENEEVVEDLQVLLLVGSSGAAGLALAVVGSVFLAGRAMQPIRHAFERQRQFIADASHELRTPVAVVRARVEVLQREPGALPAAVRDELQQLRHDAEELSELLDDLLDLARLDAGQVELVLEPVALAEVAEEVVAQLRPLADERAVALLVAAAPVWGRANLARVRQVLRALAQNALQYTPPGGQVVVDVAREGDWARLMVRDTGRGISPEHLPRVCDRFYVAEPARTRGTGRAPGGAGLGLAIVAQLVRLMRGQLQLESSPGEGTRVSVLLPLARLSAPTDF